MPSTEALLSTLEDTQASLATALARIDAYKLREKYLVEENLKLRQELSKVTGHRVPSSSSTTYDTPHLEHINYRLHEEYPVILHSKKGRVSGSLSANPGYLEILESKGRMNASQFIGMTSLTDKTSRSKGGSPKLNNKSWPWGLFGKSKTAEDISSPAAEPAPGAPSLSRKSWNGPIETIPKEEPNRLTEMQTTGKGEDVGLWRVLWKEGNSSKIKEVVFEASTAAQAFITRQIETWSKAASKVAKTEDSQASSSTRNQVVKEEVSFAAEGSIVPAKHFIPNGPYPGFSCESVLLAEEQVRCLTSALPVRYRHCTWNLLYSTEKHGISLQTLFRRAEGFAPSVMIIKDSLDFVFGCYCSEAWRMSPRFYGTGETFVFQLEPQRVYYTWKQESSIPNNFFMYGDHDRLGVGGTGHRAISLDSELLYGSSGPCDTFGSPCIASKEDFKIMKVELWALS